MTIHIKNPHIDLSLAEVQMAALVGMQRVIECLKLNASHRHGASENDTWDMSIEGAIAECALAKYLNYYWAKGQRGAPDVFDVDCRQTHYSNGRLILHDDDVDDRKYYLLVGKQGVYDVKGYILAKDGKQQKYWDDPVGQRAAYFVPQSALIQLHFLDD